MNAKETDVLRNWLKLDTAGRVNVLKKNRMKQVRGGWYDKELEVHCTSIGQALEYLLKTYATGELKLTKI